MEQYGSDVFDYAAKVTMTARETAEAFIFETVYPFCVETTKTTVKKSELAEALIKANARPVVDDEKSTVNRCPGCRVVLLSRYFGARGRIITKTKGESFVDLGGYTYHANYCPECGQKLEFGKRGKKG